MASDLKSSVYSPPHYTHGSIETIDAIKSQLTREEWEGYLKGTVMAYLARERHKLEPQKDRLKALFYLRMLCGEDPREK